MKNIARCKKCHSVIESKSRHDMVWCECGAIAVDGGNDYMKRSGNPEDFDETFRQVTDDCGDCPYKTNSAYCSIEEPSMCPKCITTDTNKGNNL